MAITDIQARNAKPKDKKYKMSDGDNLYLQISPTGTKSWLFRYKGKEVVIGRYSTLSVKQARVKRHELSKDVANDIDIAAERKLSKLTKSNSGQNTLQAVGEEWLTKFSVNNVESTNKRTKARLERNVYPYIGDKPINEVTAPELLMVLRRVEDRGAVETAHRIRSLLSQIFRYAIATGRAERDPAADLRGAIPPAEKKHFAAITEPKDIGAFIRSVDSYQGTLIVQCALKFMVRVFQRSKEVRHAEWDTIDLEASEWRVPDETMKKKGRNVHLVPLSRQVVAILKEIHPLTGHGRYVFPNARSDKRAMSDAAMLSAIRRMGYTKEMMSIHGVRTMASTNLNEQGWSADAIERQLAHIEGNAIRGAYNHAEYMDERIRFMQAWSDYLDSLANGGEVVNINKNLPSN